MKFEVEELSSVKKKINIVMPKEKIAQKVDSAYNKLKKTAKIKGFRPGKAPRNVLEKHYRDQVLEEVLNDVLQESYPKILSEEGIVPVSYPHFGGEKIKEGEDFAFSLAVDVKPKIDPKGYEGVKVKRQKVTIADDEINAEIEQLRKRLSTLSPVEGRGVEKGDSVKFDFEGFVDGEPFDRGKAEDYTLEIGSGQFIPGFEDGMVGIEKGEGGEVKARFPDDYHEKGLAGKEAVFKVNIKEINKIELPALDDDFAKDVGDFEGLEDLKEKIAGNIRETKEAQSKKEMQGALVDAILEKNAFDIPESMIEKQVQQKKEEIKGRMSSYGMPPQDVENYMGTMKNQLYKDAENDVRGGLLLEAVAEKEGVKVENEEIDAYYNELAEKTGRSPEEVKTFYADKRDFLISTLMDKKVLDFLESKAKIEGK